MQLYRTSKLEISQENNISRKTRCYFTYYGRSNWFECCLDLNKHGVLKEFGVELIGATKEAIDKAEDRELFAECMKKIGLETLSRSCPQY